MSLKKIGAHQDVTTGLWVNKGTYDKYLTSYPYTQSDKTRLAYEYILRGLAGKKAQPTQNVDTVQVRQRTEIAR